MAARMRRRETLEEAGLLFAPAWRRRAFWQSVNGRFRRAPERLGDVAHSLVDGGLLRVWASNERLRAAWLHAVGEEWARASEPVQVRGPRLIVHVDSAATRFALRRRVGAEALRALNAVLRPQRVDRVEYRIAGPVNRPEAPGEAHRSA